MGEKTVIVYGIPAYGHIWSGLYLSGRLVKEGFRVMYYSTEYFRGAIEGSGCGFLAYPFRQEELDLTDGQRILKLYRLILEYTQDMLPKLLEEAKREEPCVVMFDSLALWGRAVSGLLHVPGISFYNIAAINRAGGESFFAYANGFSADFLRYAGELPKVLRLKTRLRRRYGIRRLGLLPVLMNQGDYNLMGYSRRFQPGGNRFPSKYIFAGPMSIHRSMAGTNDFDCPEKRVIYISLGTVFNQNRALLRLFTETFGNTEDAVIVAGAGGENELKRQKYPDNFIVRPFVNQREVLRKAALFITAGGLNSIHEALYYGVPCLMCPQQGEQLLNARQFEKLGFGRILRHLERLREEAEKTMRLKWQWDEELRKQMTAVHVKKALQLFRSLSGGGEAGI